MDILQAIILGVVQGITEWLPVSSKSHLILIQELFGITQPAIFDLILHIGSLLVLLLVFRTEIWQLCSGLFSRKKETRDESWKIGLFIFIATLPIVLAGFIFEDLVKSALTDLRFLGFGFLFTALILYLSKFPRVKTKGLTVWNSLVIGIGQAVALLPGVSRSGTTISTGMILGVKKEAAAKFSFLIFIPAIVGATVLEFKEIGQIENLGALAVGTFAAISSGYFALKLLLRIIQKGRFHWFSAYCAMLGILVLLFAYGIF
jgi:undecaprenyl-diphosphatase